MRNSPASTVCWHVALGPRRATNRARIGVGGTAVLGHATHCPLASATPTPSAIASPPATDETSTIHESLPKSVVNAWTSSWVSNPETGSVVRYCTGLHRPVLLGRARSRDRYAVCRDRADSCLIKPDGVERRLVGEIISRIERGASRSPRWS